MFPGARARIPILGTLVTMAFGAACAGTPGILPLTAMPPEEDANCPWSDEQMDSWVKTYLAADVLAAARKCGAAKQQWFALAYLAKSDPSLAGEAAAGLAAACDVRPVTALSESDC